MVAKGGIEPPTRWFSDKEPEFLTLEANKNKGYFCLNVVHVYVHLETLYQESVHEKILMRNLNFKYILIKE